VSRAAATAPLDLARRAVAGASGESEGEVLVSVTRTRSSRSDRPEILERQRVEVMAVRDGRVGFARAHRADADTLDELVQAAQANARAAHEAEPYPGLQGPEPVRAHDGYDLATAALPRAELTAMAKRATETTGTGSGVIVGAAERRVGLASTRGHELVDAATVAMAFAGPSGAWAVGYAAALAGLDPVETGRRGSERARRLSQPSAELEPGVHPVVLEPEALAALLRFAGVRVFSARSPVLDGRLGTRVAAPAINLSDSPRLPATLPRAFDAEGVPKEPVPLIQDGVAHRLVHDIRSAAAAGGRSTGHARAPGGTRRPAPAHLVLVGGGAAHVEALVAPVERGVLLLGLPRPETLDPATATLGATISGGALLIEHGRIAGPLERLRIEMPVLDLLASTEALTSRPRLVYDGAAAVVCPALRAARLRVVRA